MMDLTAFRNESPLSQLDEIDPPVIITRWFFFCRDCNTKLLAQSQNNDSIITVRPLSTSAGPNALPDPPSKVPARSAPRRAMPRAASKSRDGPSRSAARTNFARRDTDESDDIVDYDVPPSPPTNLGKRDTKHSPARDDASPKRNTRKVNCSSVTTTRGADNSLAESNDNFKARDSASRGK